MFLFFFLFLHKVLADRFYLNGIIKIKRETAVLLRNMNNNVLQRTKDHDYSFVSDLLLEIFDTATLCKSIANTTNEKKTAYARLDERKYTFTENVFKERINGDKFAVKRLASLPSLINRRCSQLRAKYPILQQLK